MNHSKKLRNAAIIATGMILSFFVGYLAAPPHPNPMVSDKTLVSHF